MSSIQHGWHSLYVHKLLALIETASAFQPIGVLVA